MATAINTSIEIDGERCQPTPKSNNITPKKSSSNMSSSSTATYPTTNTNTNTHPKTTKSRNNGTKQPKQYTQKHSFFLFRLFDITKPFPIGLIDKKLKSGFGIMLDDCVASLFSIICIYVIINLWF